MCCAVSGNASANGWWSTGYSIDGRVTGKYAITYKLTKNARLLNIHGLTQKKSGCANPLWLQNVLLKKLVAVNKPTFNRHLVDGHFWGVSGPDSVHQLVDLSMSSKRHPRVMRTDH